jgi:SAM-dependent methyltransferase
MAEASIYQGNELDLFKNATCWKRYWQGRIMEYVKGDVCEVGAGIGVNTGMLLRNASGINSLLAIEPDSSLSNRIKENVVDDKRLLTVFNGYLSGIDSSKKFDTILYIDVIEHIRDDKQEINRALSRLKSGGNLIILVPAHPFLFSPFDSAIGHFRRYTMKSLRDTVGTKVGMLQMYHLDSMGAIASIVNKLLLKQPYPTERQILFWDRYIVQASRFTDMFFGKVFGKSIVGVWRK